MKRLFAFLTLFCALTFGFSYGAFAQDENETATEETAATDETAATEEEAAPAEETAVAEETAATEEVAATENKTLHQQVKEKFIEGDWQFMSPVLICLILGLAIAIERIISLNLASFGSRTLLGKVEPYLQEGNVDKAQQVAASARGPVASIFSQGLLTVKTGGSIEMVEKTVVGYGSVEMSKLEKGLVWISLFISLAPMLGFMGTVIGMIGAFDSIEAAGDISPSLVAGGIKVALLTTVAGLIVAIILQIFYNYCVSKVDSIVTEMEDASIRLVDKLIEHKVTTKA